MPRNNSLAFGLSLVELLIALTLSGVLILALISLLLLGQQDLATLKAQNQIFSQARHVEIIFREAVQHAGYLGCRNLDVLTVKSKMPPNTPFTLAVALRGFASVNDKNWQPYLPLAHVAPQTDVIMLQFLSPKNSLLKQSMQTNTSRIVLAQNVTVSTNAIALISDCQHADIFMVEHRSDNNFSPPPLSHIYETNARFGVANSQFYFIRKTERNYFEKMPIYALYREDALQNATELVAGINQLHIEYSSEGEIFVSAKKIEDWNSVKKIKINFISEAALQNKIISHSFELIILLRNRL